MNKDKVVFDVGANFEDFGVLFARLSPQARIYSFGPNPATAAALSNNLALNGVGNVIIVEKAIGSENGYIRFADSSDPATNRILEGVSVGISASAPWTLP